MKTREKLFTELKAELELHTSLEEQHLFPILRRNAETKELVAEAVKDNKELRAKLAELEALPKSDEAFPERLKELQKTFRQHARDEKRELLPAVQRALSEEQVQGVTDKIEAGVAEAEQARQDELEVRRLKARQERQEAEPQAERQAEAERTKQAAAEQDRHDEAAQKRLKARQEREEADRQAEQAAAVQRAQEEAERRAHEVGEAVAHTAMAAPTNVLNVAKTATANAQRVGTEIQGVTDTYVDAVKSMVPDFRTAASLSKAAVTTMTEIRSAWIEWMRQTTRTGTQMSQELLEQAAEQQRRFAADVMQGWMEHNARIMDITARVARESFRPVANRSANSVDRGNAR
jgi:DNA repair exonuclease SbcCD ATPase subunit